MRSSSIVELKKRLEAESNKNNSQTFERTQELKQYAQARKTATQSEVITSDVNAQISERQKELAQIAAARRLAAHEILPKEEKGQDIKSNSAASEFKNNIKVSDLRNQLVNKIHFSPVINTQKSIIDEDMKSLLNTGTHVLEKARELDRLLIFGSKKL